MKIWVICSVLALFLNNTVAFADSILAARTIRSHTILTRSDIFIEKNDMPSAISKLSDVIGFETQVVLYEGRPISNNDIGPPAIVSRNQIVTLVYLHGNLSIEVDGRSLERAGAGELVRVMNLDSRTTLNGIVTKNGKIVVGN